MKRDRVAIAVPTVRDPDRLARCLDSARRVAAADGIEIELVVVVDGADPEVSAYLESGAPDATVLSWPERRGIAAALNAAFRAARCTFVAVLQDDAVARPGWLGFLFETASRRPRAGAVGPLVLSPDGTVQSAGAIICGDGSIAMPWVGDPPAADTFVDLRSVDYVSSSSVLVRRDAWSEAGGFDEELYPAMSVDVDFCTALWNVGWLVLLDPRAVVVHDRHGSTTRPFREFVSRRNQARYMSRWGRFVAGRPVGLLDRAEVEASVRRSGRWLDDPPPSVSPSGRAPAASPPGVYVERERDVLRAYRADLEERFEALEEKADLLQAQCDKRLEVIRELSRECDERLATIESLRATCDERLAIIEALETVSAERLAAIRGLNGVG